MRSLKVGAGVVAALFVLFLIGGCFYTIDARERGVLLQNGAVVEQVGPGLHFKTPFIERVVAVSVESHRVELKGMEAYSRDQQPANLILSVVYRAQESNVADVYRRFGSLEGVEERVILPKVQEQAKNVFGQFDAVTAVQDRVQLNSKIAAAIHEAVNSLGAPIVVESVQVENIEFSTEYMKSIELRMMAAVEVERLKQNALREQVQAEITVTQARGRADATRTQAEADAAAIRLRGQAEADAIRARGEALGLNPSLVSLIQAERWDGKLPVTMVPGGTLPFLAVK